MKIRVVHVEVSALSCKFRSFLNKNVGLKKQKTKQNKNERTTNAFEHQDLGWGFPDSSQNTSEPPTTASQPPN